MPSPIGDRSFIADLNNYSQITNEAAYRAHGFGEPDFVCSFVSYRCLDYIYKSHRFRANHPFFILIMHFRFLVSLPCLPCTLPMLRRHKWVHRLVAHLVRGRMARPWGLSTTPFSVLRNRPSLQSRRPTTRTFLCPPRYVVYGPHGRLCLTKSQDISSYPSTFPWNGRS